MKILAMIRIKMVVSVVQDIGIFFSHRQVKKLFISVAFKPCDRKIEEDKLDSMLWLDFNKILKILIGIKNCTCSWKMLLLSKYFSLIHGLARYLATYNNRGISLVLSFISGKMYPG